MALRTLISNPKNSQRTISGRMFEAALAQLGERQTEDLKAPCSIHGGGIFFDLDEKRSFIRKFDV